MRRDAPCAAPLRVPALAGLTPEPGALWWSIAVGKESIPRFVFQRVEAGSDSSSRWEISSLLFSVVPLWLEPDAVKTVPETWISEAENPQLCLYCVVWLRAYI